MSRLDHLALLARTAQHVPPRQLRHRVRLRAKRLWYRRRSAEALLGAWAGGIETTSVGWPDGFVPSDGLVDHAGPTPDGVFHLIAESLDPVRDGWRSTARSQLFRYHLHYFDWAWALADSDGGREQFASLWRSWLADTRPGRWDEWSPYVVSIRSWNLCAVHRSLVAGSPVEDSVRSNLAASLGYLRRNVELDVGGNHLVKNLKAIFGLGVFLDRADDATWALDQLIGQLGIQVLSDGGHFELSLGYHAQVMADLLDVHDLGVAAGLGGTEPFVAPIEVMADWLGTMSWPDGSLPLLGDTVPQSAALLDRLRQFERSEAGSTRPRVVHLAASGYVVLHPRPGVMAVFDFGRPCPEALPAHAQADWGTFELWIDGERVVADPGVSSYVGERRAWERSTIAHNTLCIEDRDQTEVWASFRAGRRARPGTVCITETSNEVQILAELQTFDGHHQTRHVVINGDRLTITDHAADIQFGCSSLTLAEQHLRRVLEPADASFDVVPVQVGDGFGRLRPAVLLAQRVSGDTAPGWTLSLAPEAAE